MAIKWRRASASYSIPHARRRHCATGDTTGSRASTLASATVVLELARLAVDYLCI